MKIEQRDGNREREFIEYPISFSQMVAKKGKQDEVDMCVYLCADSSGLKNG